MAAFTRAGLLLRRMQHCSLDFFCVLHNVSAVPEEALLKGFDGNLNKVIRKDKPFLSCGFPFVSFSIFDLHFCAYVDASFAINTSLSSIPRCVKLLCNTHNCFHILDYLSCNSCRLLSLINCSELYTFRNVFETSTTISKAFIRTFSMMIQIEMCTDPVQSLCLIAQRKRFIMNMLAIVEAPLVRLIKDITLWAIKTCV